MWCVVLAEANCFFLKINLNKFFSIGKNLDSNNLSVCRHEIHQASTDCHAGGSTCRASVGTSGEDNDDDDDFFVKKRSDCSGQVQLDEYLLSRSTETAAVMEWHWSRNCLFLRTLPFQLALRANGCSVQLDISSRH